MAKKCGVFIVIGIFFSSMFAAKAMGTHIINRFEVEKQGDVIWEVPTIKKQVAITFDDGPDPVYTPLILDVLKENHAHATFFLIGKRVKMYPDIVLKELEEGHELGNHTFSHPSFYQISQGKVLDELTRTEQLLNPHHLEEYIKLFRPPGGAVTDSTLNLLKKQGYKIILWSWHQDPRDWTNPGAERIARHVIKNVKNGDIILLHDAGGSRMQTVSALKMILPALKEKGYDIVTVNDLLKMHPKYNEFYR